MKNLCLLMCLVTFGVFASPTEGRAESAARVVVSAISAPVFVKPDATFTPLRMATQGSALNVIASEGAWYRVEFQDPQWGRRVGYIEKRHVTVQMAAPLQEPVDLTVAEYSPSRYGSDLEQPQIREAALGAQGSVPTTPPQPTRPLAATPFQQNPHTQRSDVAVGYVFLYDDGQSVPLGFAASNAWRVHPSVDIAVEAQFSHKTYDFGFVSDAATEWSLLAGSRFWFGSRYQGTRAFGQVLGGMLSVKPVFTDAIYGLGVQPGFGVEVPVSRAVAIRPQYDLMIGRLQGVNVCAYECALNSATWTDHRFKVNVVFRLFGG